MMQKMIKAIESQGALLVFPIKEKTEPASLWSILYPRSSMRWEWDEGGDPRVFRLWQSREELSRSGKVVYSKWFQGRATFFSRELFVNLLAYLRSEKSLSSESANILEALELDSPLSTKQVKIAAEMQGKWFEAAYNHAMKPLWQQGLIVGFGEVDDSSFPSLAVGATKNLFEDLWQESFELSSVKAEAYLRKKWGEHNKFWLYAQKIRRALEG